MFSLLIRRNAIISTLGTFGGHHVYKSGHREKINKIFTKISALAFGLGAEVRLRFESVVKAKNSFLGPSISSHRLIFFFQKVRIGFRSSAPHLCLFRKSH